MASSKPQDTDSWVFINMPYGEKHESMLIALTVVTIAMKRQPFPAFLIADRGSGRISKIVEAIKQCPYSIHDLSIIPEGLPRYNMPFELGIACAFNQIGYPQEHPHAFCVYVGSNKDAEKTLTDLKFMDPQEDSGFLNDGSSRDKQCEAAICAIIDELCTDDNNPNAEKVFHVFDHAVDTLRGLKAARHARTLFKPSIYNDFIDVVFEFCVQEGILVDAK